MKLYHTGYEEIRTPDLSSGRKNADFGQGFYLSPDRAFSRMWGRPMSGADVIIGPIANDTLFDTFGITTSGLLSPETSLSLLQLGPEYTQVVLRTEKALSRLTWTGAERMTEDAVRKGTERAAREEAAYQEAFAALLEKET